MDFVSEKAKAQDAAYATYVSTENMQADFGGVAIAATVPKSGSVTKFIIGDTLFSNIRTYFKKVWQAEFDGYCSNDVLVFRTKDETALHPGFLNNLCRWEKFTEFSIRTSKGAKMPRGDKDALAQFKFELPSIEEQRAIAKTLRSFDNKIDLNRRINQTLEAMAQAIFKSWFVDFDPVKAKIAAIEQGQDPLRAAMRAISGKTDAELDQMPREHHDQLAATAALFPDAIEESELGEIPKGWAVGAFKQCCLRVESGGTPSRKEPLFWDGSIPWLTSGEVRDVVVLDTKEKITPDGLDSSSAKLWPPMTTVVAMYGATAGQVCLLAKEMTANQACCALIPLAEFKAFIFIAARQSIQQLSEKASGSAQQNLNKSLVENHAHVVPTKNIAEKFEKATTTLLQRWIQNQKEIATLGMVRDTLLPKLLSGELRVPDTEFITEEMWP